MLLVATTEVELFSLSKASLSLSWASIALFFSGCGMQYTRHIVEGYQNEKLSGKSFALLPLPEIQYQEPSSCFGKGSTDGSKYQSLWDGKILSSLKAQHPKNTFEAFDKDRLGDDGVDYLALQSAAEAAAREFNVSQIDLNANNPVKVELSQKISPVAAAQCRKLKEKNFDFVVIPIHPEMHGEVHTTYNAGAPGMPGGASSQTVYYSDLQFVVYAAETGEAIYASGVLASSSGLCFVPPQTATVQGSGNQLAKRISDLVAKVLQWRKTSEVAAIHR